jgi:hypothetical protein
VEKSRTTANDVEQIGFKLKLDRRRGGHQKGKRLAKTAGIEQGLSLTKSIAKPTPRQCINSTAPKPSG